MIDGVKKAMPILPNEWRGKLASLGLNTSQIETLMDAHVEFQGVDFLGKIEKSMNEPKFAKFLVKTFINITIPKLRANPDFTASILLSANKALYQMIESGQLSSTAAKEVSVELMKTNKDPKKIAEEKNLLQVSDESAIAEIVIRVIEQNHKAAEDVRNGEMKAIGFLVGQVMKESKGQANPAVAQQLIKKQLGSLKGV